MGNLVYYDLSEWGEIDALCRVFDDDEIGGYDIAWDGGGGGGGGRDDIGDGDGYGGDAGDHGAGDDDGGDDDGGDGGYNDGGDGEDDDGGDGRVVAVATTTTGTPGASNSRSARDVYTNWMARVVRHRRSGALGSRAGGSPGFSQLSRRSGQSQTESRGVTGPLQRVPPCGDSGTGVRAGVTLPAASGQSSTPPPSGHTDMGH
ncbi:glycine-rich cell wall structural protein 2-like [Cryptomeria japonica]|uniref:glycine-rich cell wall structural protein 2-like n=1 Tax=Cryptomeria japonica TaxID=3369 RepID=UPI0027DA6956|nr:glycine-rich cell wall structural protein 2-like [Cryptomeria japonica]